MQRPGKPFVILGKARSGTNYLNWKLLLSKQVLLGWEPFNGAFLAYTGFEHFNIPTEVQARIQSKDERDRDRREYVNYCSGLTGALDGSGVGFSGFKIFYAHDPDMYWRMTRDARFNALVVERESRLAAYSSLLIARKTKEWSRAVGLSAPDEQVKVHFNPEDFQDFRTIYDDEVDQTLTNLRDSKVDHLHLRYEEFVGNPAALRAIFAFLGITAEPAEDDSLQRQNSPNLLDRFENPEDVLPWLAEEQKR